MLVDLPSFASSAIYQASMSCQKHRLSWIFASVATISFVAAWIIVGVAVLPEYQRARQIDRITCTGTFLSEEHVPCMAVLEDCQTISTTRCDVVFPSCSEYNTTSPLGAYRCCQGSRSCQLNIKTCTEYSILVIFDLDGETQYTGRYLTYAVTQKIPFKSRDSKLYDCWWDNETHQLLDTEWELPSSTKIWFGFSIFLFVAFLFFLCAACYTRFRTPKPTDFSEMLNPTN